MFPSSLLHLSATSALEKYNVCSFSGFSISKDKATSLAVNHTTSEMGTGCPILCINLTACSGEKHLWYMEFIQKISHII
jgi:hypothetical protein